MSNKNKNKAKKNGKSTLSLVQEILGVIGGIVGSVMTIYGFIKTFRDDVDGFTWILFLGGAIWLIVLWQMFQRQKTYAYIYLAFTIVSGVAGWVGWQSQVQAKDDKVIVLIAKFDGPEEDYRLRDELLRQTKARTKDFENVEIIPLNEIIIEADGSARAKEIGEKKHADLVIWGWYTSTTVPNLNLYAENLSSNQFVTVSKNGEYRPEATLNDLETLQVQQQIGSEISDLISFLVAYVYYETRDFPLALSTLEQIKKDSTVFSDQGNVLLLKANLHLFTTEYALALDEYTRLIDFEPKKADLYQGRCLTYVGLELLDQALNDCTVAITLDADNANYYSSRGVVYLWSTNNLDLAAQDLDMSIALDPTNPTSYYNRGLIYLHQEQYNKAIDVLNTSIALDPYYSSAYLNRGIARMMINEYEQATIDFDRAIELEPDNINALNTRGVYKAAIGDFELAIQDYNRVLEIEPTSVAAYLNRGDALARLGKFDQALSDYNYLIQLDPDLPMAYYNRGTVYSDIKKYENAVLDYSKSIELDPEFPDAYVNRGISYFYLGEYSEAIQDYAQAEILVPNNYKVYVNRAILYNRINNLEQALIDCNKSVELNPYCAECYAMRATVYKALGKYNEFESDVSKYKELTGEGAP